jgi:hypothetical protein
MKKSWAFILQIIIGLIGIGVLFWLLWEPQLEGININKTFFEIYFKDPFLVYIYLGSLPFFVGIYQAIKALECVRKDRTFSLETARALQKIKYCALITAVAIVGADAYLALFVGLPGKDDPAGAIMLGMITTLISLIIAIVAKKLERKALNSIS